MTEAHRHKLIKAVEGPILIVGASGFVGANLLHQIGAVRDDVFGTFFGANSWRLQGVAAHRLCYMDLMRASSIQSVLDKVRPRTVFYCAAFGAYSFQTDGQRIYETNFVGLSRFLESAASSGIGALIHAGSSSEYGDLCAAPAEESARRPNSAYAVSKAAASDLLHHYGREKGLRCANLRLYSVYGPFEDASRLVPALCLSGLDGALPPMAAPDTTRDFIHVDDVVDAFCAAALNLPRDKWGEAFNIGTGRKTSLRQVAHIAREIFDLSDEPVFGAMARAWDLPDWYSNPAKAETVLGWKAVKRFEEGLKETAVWWQQQRQGGRDPVLMSEKTRQRKAKASLTAIVACYKDAQAIPIMHRRLTDALSSMALDYEIIFVNDCSPDDSAEVIREISARDPRVTGISHSRNFGSQAAFRSGMELATRESCVLLDGDLQDPPELIADFVRKWREGYDIVYGRRVQREMPKLQEFFYKAFYKVFAALSNIPVPRDAGDFSLIDARVARWMLACGERDSLLRGLRAYVGFRQTGVDYVRPERLFGRSTNNLLKNLNWAKMAIFSFSTAPLAFFTLAGFLLLGLTALLVLSVILSKLFAPDLTPPGVTTMLLAVMFFGSVNLLGIAIVGEYVGKILTETKARPAFIRQSLISDGRIDPVGPTVRARSSAAEG